MALQKVEHSREEREIEIFKDSVKQLIESCHVAISDLSQNERINSKEISKIRNIISSQEAAIQSLQKDNKMLHNVIFKQIYPVLNETHINSDEVK